MRKTVLLTAAVLMAATTAAPVAAGPIELSDREIAKYGKRYLSIICPANRANDNMNKAFERAHGQWAYYGEAIPEYERKAYGRAATAYSRVAVRMNRTDWPAEIAGPAERIERYYYSKAPRYRRVSRSSRWSKSLFTYRDGGYDHGNAPTVIRRALELPPRGEGC